MADVDAELERFEAGLVDAATFTHREHLRMAFEMLARHDFEEALGRYARGLRRLTARIGATQKYHTTITVAFLAVVAERRAISGAESWDAFIRVAPELLDRRCLSAWYPSETLGSDVARRTFVLPPTPGREDGPSSPAGDTAASAHRAQPARSDAPRMS